MLQGGGGVVMKNFEYEGYAFLVGNASKMLQELIQKILSCSSYRVESHILSFKSVKHWNKNYDNMHLTVSLRFMNDTKNKF